MTFWWFGLRLVWLLIVLFEDFHGQFHGRFHGFVGPWMKTMGLFGQGYSLFGAGLSRSMGYVVTCETGGHFHLDLAGFGISITPCFLRSVGEGELTDLFLEDLADIDVLPVEEDHLVEGSKKWLVGKVLAPMPIDHDMLIQVFKAVWKDHTLEDATVVGQKDVLEFQFGPWLKVDFTKSSHDSARRAKPGIVLTKKGVAATDSTGMYRAEGTLIVWSNRYDRERRDGTENMMGKRSYGRKDGENPQLASKKARSTIADTGHGVNERHEETPPPMVLISVEAVGQPRRMP
ncbi:hypothetical protein V6N12_018687 [Hibiscus sabdariffa]|uniref:DUF4283 domain-containing protein n=1 Tax=Hibiscus sabdariffa TaxID=183260 RepID=A0ABR2AL32_9ROSI